MFEYLQQEREAFELFKKAYKAQFPAAVSEPTAVPLNVPVPELTHGVGAQTADTTLLFVSLDTTLLSDVDEGTFANLEWL